MARMVPSSIFNCRWMSIEIMSRCGSGWSTCSRLRADPTCTRHFAKPLSLVNLGVKETLFFADRRFSNLCRTVASPHFLARGSQRTDALCSMNGSLGVERLTSFSTNVTVNFDVQERQIPRERASSETIAEQHDDGFRGHVKSVVQANLVDASAEEIVVGAVEVSVTANVEKDVVPMYKTYSQSDQGKWWHIPDSIDEVLPLPADFEERLEVLFRSFGRRIDSRELLLRVLVHKSYYDQKVPVAIKDKEYMKPHAPLFIDSGEVTQQYVEGLRSKTISCMMCGDAHGEVRSQLAILGDAVIGLAVTSLLVHQHPSAGMITERKCQLVSNSNLSRVWKTLLGPQEFVLSCGESSSQLAAQSRMMADSCEAYIGALYTEQGLEPAFTCVNNALLPLLVQADSVRNPVHALNLQSSMAFQVLPEYRLIGVDNENTQHQNCRVRVYVKGIRMATGMGMNQKLARVDAAQKALQKWPTVFCMV